MHIHRNSGVSVRETAQLPPGDLRSAISALSNDMKKLTKWQDMQTVGRQVGHMSRHCVALMIFHNCGGREVAYACGKCVNVLIHYHIRIRGMRIFLFLFVYYARR